MECAYGPPWDHAARTRVLRWMPKHGFNAYVHAPKDDLYQRTYWRDLYPPAERAEFKREPSYFAAAGYAGCLVYTEGVKRAGSLDADKVREHILKLDLRTPFGEFKVDPDGVQLAHKMVTFQWQKEKKVIVWPDDLAQGKVLFPTPPWTSR